MTDSTNSADWRSEAVPNETSGRAAGKDRRTDSNGATVGGKVRQMSTGKLLVVDDDNNLVELVRVKLQSAGYEVATASKAEDAIEAAKGAVFDLCILDLRLADRSGISLMRELHSINPDMPVIILTGYGSVESAVEAMQEGAYNYLTKPFNTQELLLQIKRALENRRLNSEIQRLRGLLEEQFDFTNIVARSDKMRSVLDIVSRIANTESTVYLHGESGTGKEIIAKAIHLQARDATTRLWPSIAPLCLKHYLKASCLDMKREPSPAPTEALKDYLARLMKEPFSWMKLAICRPRFRRNSCARYKSVSSIPLEAKSQFSWMFESSSPRISNWRTRWQRAHFVRIYFIGFTSFQSICLLSERGKKISHTWPIVFSKSFRNR